MSGPEHVPASAPPDRAASPAAARPRAAAPGPGHERSAIAGPRGMPPQLEITMGRSSDPHEREANRVAELALRTSGRDGERGQRRAASPARLSEPATAAGVAPPLVHEVLRSPGEPLDAASRAFFEPALGSDLAGVRVHRDATAAASARAVDALAYTVDSDIVFASGRYAPGTTAGRRLLAHELVHVLQRRTAPDSAGRQGDGALVGRRLARQDDARVVEEEPSAPAAVLDPWTALDKITAWRVKASTLIDGVSAWQRDNWVDFLKRTSLSPWLSLSDSQLAALASNAVGNAITTVGKGVIDGMAEAIATKAALMGAGLGTLFEPGGGTVVGFAIGFVIGVVIETAASWVFENVSGKTEVDKAAAAAAMRTGDYIADQLTAVTVVSQTSRASLEAVVSALNARVRDAATQSDVDEIGAWADREVAETPEPTAPGDRSLANELLRIWVLEHAATSEAEQRGTSEAQWQGALEHLSLGTSLEDQPMIFAFQTTAEWAKVGLDYRAQSDAMMAKANELVVAAASTGDDPATAVQQYFHDRKYVLTVKDRDALGRYMDEHAAWLHGPVSRIIEAGCTLDVNTWHGSAYIDEWKWVVVYEYGDADAPHKSYLDEHFDVWLTWPYNDIFDILEEHFGGGRLTPSP
jgi:hypothetical protein